jgi:hypothetical protein
MGSLLILNLGGEGEIPFAINQQPPFALNPSWRSTTILNPGKTIGELAAEGHVFVICHNTALGFADNSVDLVYTNNVPIDRITHLGPSPQSSEIQRVLKSSGDWYHDGVLRWRKP